VSEPSTEQLSGLNAAGFDSESLRFEGPRGDRARHLSRAALEAALAALPPAPRDEGRLDLMVARGPNGERRLPLEARLTVDGGMPEDRWATEKRYGPEFQLATTRSDFARLVANGQPPELHGDNLFLQLDLGSGNLPAGSLLRLGQALLRVTPQAHNGCKKWVQRFGLHAMQLNLAPDFRHRHLRGIYLQVIESGHVHVGDKAVVLERGAAL
jgi:MOSC domain-containing protein